MSLQCCQKVFKKMHPGTFLSNLVASFKLARIFKILGLTTSKIWVSDPCTLIFCNTAHQTRQKVLPLRPNVRRRRKRLQNYTPSPHIRNFRVATFRPNNKINERDIRIARLEHICTLALCDLNVSHLGQIWNRKVNTQQKRGSSAAIVGRVTELRPNEIIFPYVRLFGSYDRRNQTLFVRPNEGGNFFFHPFRPRRVCADLNLSLRGNSTFFRSISSKFDTFVGINPSGVFNVNTDFVQTFPRPLRFTLTRIYRRKNGSV